MNEHARSRWSDLDLERYYDGELPAQLRAAMTTDLFASEALRDRLDRVASVDELGRRALLGDVQPRIHASTLNPTARRAILATAATLVVMVTGMATRTMWQRSAQPSVVVSASAPIAQPTYSQRSLALSIPVSAEFRFESLRDDPQNVATTTSPENEAIHRALGQGRIDDALRLLAKSNVQDQTLEWSRLGEMMQSAQRARSAILYLPLDKQIEIVRVWSRKPSLRPVVFKRLEELLRDPTSATAALELRGELAQNPQLTSWVQSYAAR